ncbi:uncharacterized protein LOC129570693 [Sitodiplosis mosellana]|uniref:uncharacterized protein LOC129570693 n=1 Tax=Sitodiplosis mosellana TaxID=263140 RepID=UPI0024447B6F|nr:uncharacterized protein LOC129570693 [Sitodiplosis mosellana]
MCRCQTVLQLNQIECVIACRNEMKRTRSEMAKADVSKEPSSTDDVAHQNVVSIAPKKVTKSQTNRHSSYVECIICGHKMALADLIIHQKSAHSNVKDILSRLNAGKFVRSETKAGNPSNGAAMVRCKFCRNKMPSTALESHQRNKHLSQYIRMQMHRPYVSVNQTRPTHLPIESIRPEPEPFPTKKSMLSVEQDDDGFLDLVLTEN